MPIYTFVDNNTGEEFEENMSYDNRTQFLKDNPHLEHIITGMNIGRDGGLKHTPEFREVLQKVKHHHPLEHIDTGNLTDI